MVVAARSPPHLSQAEPPAQQPLFRLWSAYRVQSKKIAFFSLAYLPLPAAAIRPSPLSLPDKHEFTDLDGRLQPLQVDFPAPDNPVPVPNGLHS